MQVANLVVWNSKFSRSSYTHVSVSGAAHSTIIWNGGTFFAVHSHIPHLQWPNNPLSIPLNDTYSLVPRPCPAFHCLQYGKVRSFLQPKMAGTWPGTKAYWHICIMKLSTCDFTSREIGSVPAEGWDGGFTCSLALIPLLSSCRKVNDKGFLNRKY